MRGKYIVIEGADGVGKTTQLQLLKAALLSHGHDVAITREPGGTPIGVELRKFLLAEEYEFLRDEVIQLLGFNYDRAILVRKLVADMLKHGRLVITDRSWLSTVAYQSFAGGMDLDTTIRICELAMSGHMPDRIFLLDVPVDEAVYRMSEQGRVLDYYDAKSPDFHQKVRDGYQWCAKRYDYLTTVIDGTQSVEAISEYIVQETLGLIEDSV